MSQQKVTTATVSAMTPPNAAIPNSQACPPGSPEAWIVFSDQASVWWAKVLKAGFRHCFMIQREANGWRILDPFTRPPKMAALPFPSSFDLPGWLEGQGLMVAVATPIPMAQTARWNRWQLIKRAWPLYRSFNWSYSSANPPLAGNPVLPS